MTAVQILKSWDWPDLRRQTPGERGVWDDVEFLFEPAASSDYVVILGGVRQPLVIDCPPSHVWQVLQEPPDEMHRYMHRGLACARRIYTQDATLRGERYVASQPALPWHINSNYDSLINAPVPDKAKSLSWVTSAKAITAGHRARMRFLARLQGGVDLDLYGRGFRYIVDKWDGLAPYRYSIAVENYRNPYYWSEKLADCFLAWSMPIYYGCSRIDDYFPSEAMVCIDINDPMAVEQVRDVVRSDLWRQRLDAIAEARRLVLERHQLFPWLVSEIEAHRRVPPGVEERRPVTLANRMRAADILRSLPSRARHAYWTRLAGWPRRSAADKVLS